MVAIITTVIIFAATAVNVHRCATVNGMVGIVIEEVAKGIQDFRRGCSVIL